MRDTSVCPTLFGISESDYETNPSRRFLDTVIKLKHAVQVPAWRQQRRADCVLLVDAEAECEMEKLPAFFLKSTYYEKNSLFYTLFGNDRRAAVARYQLMRTQGVRKALPTLRGMRVIWDSPKLEVREVC